MATPATGITFDTDLDDDALFSADAAAVDAATDILAAELDAADAAAMSRRPRCIECGRNLLTENAWFTGPAGDICISCEANQRRRAAMAKLTAGNLSRVAQILAACDAARPA